jgi:hypothetical protein
MGSTRVNVESARRRQSSSAVPASCKDANEDQIFHGKEVWLCMNKQGETCFVEHLSTNTH